MATYYINADTGDDTTGDGSQGNPWLTPSKAISTATSGDTIIAQNSTSTYLWGGNFGNKSITFQGESAANVIIDAGNALATFTIDAGTVHIKNMTFQGLRVTSSQTGGFRQIDPVGLLSCENCIFRNNVINHNRGGIFYNISIPSVTTNLTNCLFYGNTSTASAPLVVRVAAIVYLNMVNTVIHFDGTSGFLLGDFVQGYGGTSSVNVSTNCIFYNTQTNTPGIGGTYNYCCYFNTGGGSGTNNINQDPLFIDAANRNYNLSPSSPCIDAGTLI